MLGILLNNIYGEEDNECDNDRVYELPQRLRCDYISKADCDYESLINNYDLFYCKLGERYVLFALISVLPSLS